MFSIQPQHKSSYLTNKRNQLRKQIRRQQLDAYFSSIRKLQLQKDISQIEKTKYLNNFGHILDKFLGSESNEQAENHIKTIFDELTRDNVDFQAAILLQPQKLIKAFILFPNNRYSVQIFHMMIEYCYDQTFGLDDQKFVCLFNENSFEVIIEHKEMTEYQQAMEILMKTIHQMIPQLQDRRLIQHLTSLKEMEEANQNNKRIEKRLKMYLVCLGNLSIRVNSFLMRYEYVEKYLSIWSKWLLVDYDFCKGHILRYVNLVARFVIPYQSLSKFAGQNISRQQCDASENIVLRLFELCVPQGEKERVDNDKHEILAISIIEPLFSYAELRIGVVVKFFDQICRLLRVVIVKRQHFKLPIVTKMFRLIHNVINRFVEEANNRNAIEHDINLIKSINIVEIVKQMEFLQTFSFYVCYEPWSHVQIFRIICALIEYCIVFNIEIEQVILYKNFFVEICHKITHEDREIMATNLRSLNMICRYAEVCQKNKLFATMVNYGVRENLESLANALFDEFAGNQAGQLLDLYFTEEQVEEYIRIDQEKQKEMEKEEFEIPDRREIYDD